MLRVKWSDTHQVTLINTYVPNNAQDQPDFWADIEHERRTKRLPKPDFLLGDFNLTEDPIDRSPPKPNNQQAIEALRNLRHAWGIQDQWRHDNPSGRVFTFKYTRDGTYRHARLDRIYTANRHACHLFEWEAKPTEVPTDHWLVSVKFAPKDAPLIGNGRWTWPLLSLNNEKLINKVVKKGIRVQEKIEEAANQPEDQRQESPQTLWNIFKKDITSMAKKELNDEKYKISTKIRLLEEDIKSITNNPEIDENENLRTELAYLSSELAQMKKKIAKEQRDNTRAQIAAHGERPGGIWSAINKIKKPRDLITRLKIPNANPVQYERSTKRMAELARNYHESLQNAGINPEPEERRNEQIERTLAYIPETQRIESPERTDLQNVAQKKHVDKAISLAKSGSSTGLDGCPYELWKKLKERHEYDSLAGKPNFDIVKTLTLVYQDIQIYGTHEEADFAEGWMCPIYKKKDRAEISNYRPITLLNTDYKLLTKVLALQLVDEIQTMLHPDQTGFVPKRTIFNNIRLASTILSYAELTDTDGAIVALDQEKAYDKIRHDYLWKTLERFQIPDTFIKTVRELYKHAHTKVAINGTLSSPYKVTRGVRQGDPLSCALFNLAIEPLACRIRADENIKGLEIPGIDEKVIISLYADDTNLILSKNDSFDYVETILDDWCYASGAKFNKEKTEIVPIGTPEYRTRMIDTRKLNETDRPIDPKIKIADEGEAIRILGAWIGNNTDAAAPWEPILDKIHKSLEHYNKSFPTLFGRQLITHMIIGGCTQFLAQAQGMPKQIENILIQTTRKFMWEDNTKPRIALGYLYYPNEEGGLHLLDIKARNEAIEIIWLKSYLNMSPGRPTWAKIADIILDATAPSGYNAQARMNTFLQTWKTPRRGTRAGKIDRNITRMLETARKHNVNFMTIKLSQELKQQLPAWFQTGADHWAINNKAARCLLHKHKARTIADLMRTSARLRENANTQAHRPTNYCNCPACADDHRKDCTHPHDCAKEALARINRTIPKLNPLYPQNRYTDNLSLTPRRKEQNRKAKDEKAAITFDPSVTAKDDLAECFRVFTNPQREAKTPAQRPRNEGADNRYEETQIYTDGSCSDNGKENAKCGGGAWFGRDDPRNKAIRVPGNKQSNQKGEIAAVIVALQDFPHFLPLEIISDSTYVIDGLTTNLQTWEDNGWIGIEHAALFKKAAFLLRRRSAKTTFRWTKSHAGTLGNEESDRLAKEGAGKDAPDPLDLSIPPEFDIQGAKLRTITQSTAYQGILSRQPRPPRPDAAEHLQCTKQAIRDANGTQETDATIWESLRRKILRPRVQQFLYKTIHKVYMIGERWREIPGCERRGICTACNEEESMTHILLECNAIGQATVWRKAREIWPQNWQRWPNVTIGTILGIGQITLGRNPRQQEDNNAATRRMRGQTRLLQILISEASHLIWVLRCERVIHNQNRQYTDQEVTARWTKKINDRLTTDRITATKIKRNKAYTKLINATWQSALEQKGIPHQNWLQSREVFSG